MIQAMYSGISGMRAFKASLDVIGNNIANVNTVGYKSTRVTFKDMLCQTLNGGTSPTGMRGGVNPNQVGLGVNIGSIDVDLSPGSMQATGRQTDLAIEGNGHFALSDGSGISFTRDGTFGLDAKYNLVSTSTGMKVLGWNADAAGAIDTTTPITNASGIRIPVGGLSQAQATRSVKIGGNLDAAAAVGDSRPLKFYIYDSLGLTHEMNVEFAKTANAADWTYTITCPDVSATVPVSTGHITFDEEGHSELPSVDISLVFATPNGSETPLQATISMAEINQLNGQHTADMTFQDGLPLGTLESFGIDRYGIITGTFTNGSTRALGQVAIAEFNNPAGLARLGNNLLGLSANSGSSRIGVAGTGSRGVISSGFLEASNVDLAKEFADMIVSQRGFQANSRIISVSDEVLQDLVSLKR